MLVHPIVARADGPGEPAEDTGDDVALAETRARAHFESGTVFFEAEAYEDALHDFELAYEESSRPELLWNIYLCHDRLGQLDEAFATLQRFGAAGAPGHDVTLVQERLDELRARIDARGPRIDEVAPVPVDATPYLAIGGFSVAALGLVGFAIFGPLTLVENEALGTECGTSCTAERAAMLDVYAIVADISAGVALAGAIVGTIGILVAPQPSPTPTSGATLRLAPWVSGASAGLLAMGSF